MKRQTLVTQTANTRVLSWGDPGKPTLVCLHGLGGTPLSFLQLIEPLKTHFHILAPYIPGSGSTPEFEAPDSYEMPQLVAWLHSLLLQLTCKPVVLLSHSWGAHIGLYTQNRYPNLIQKHLMLDGGYYLRSPDVDTIAALESEISEQIVSDNEYRFDRVTDYIEAEKADSHNWNGCLEQAAIDRMIDVAGELQWHLSNDMTAKAFRGIFNAPPLQIYNEVKTNELFRNTKLLVATTPASRTDRKGFSELFHQKTGIPIQAVADAGHSIHIDQPTEVIEQLLELTGIAVS